MPHIRGILLDVILLDIDVVDLGQDIGEGSLLNGKARLYPLAIKNTFILLVLVKR